MGVPIWGSKTGTVFLRNFDSGVLTTVGGVPDISNPKDKCYKVQVDFGRGPVGVPIFFSQPEPIFKKMIFPFISINRDDFSPALSRWMSIGQLEYRAGVSGTYVSGTFVSGGYGQFEQKLQATPYDMIYTISVWDRYESPAQTLILKVLKALPPIGKLIVYDSLGLLRSYEYYHEGSVASLQELIDPVTRVRGYALTIKVDGELDLVDTAISDTVSGIDLSLYLMP